LFAALGDDPRNDPSKGDRRGNGAVIPLLERGAFWDDEPTLVILGART
jgi:hypothetical protein